jgi:hypothetical protein
MHDDDNELFHHLEEYLQIRTLQQKALRRLSQLIDSDDSREALSAINLLLTHFPILPEEN